VGKYTLSHFYAVHAVHFCFRFIRQQPVCPRMLLAFSCDIIHYFWVIIQPQLQQTTLSDKVKICELPRTLWPDSDSSLFGSFEWYDLTDSSTVCVIVPVSVLSCWLNAIVLQMHHACNNRLKYWSSRISSLVTNYEHIVSRHIFLVHPLFPFTQFKFISEVDPWNWVHTAWATATSTCLLARASHLKES